MMVNYLLINIFYVVSFQLPECLFNRLIITNVSECLTIPMSLCTSIQRQWTL